ncbi:MAG: hypothetical protein AVDCRST_MAG86-278 [uncultured Truepera sp.]|uniref:Sulfite oxidase n=1 Tax=uncultured Truepera sp. TaxID=543023 RepID=A0A6J4UQE8_9DEIN|nr:MAG: hypothetical protein AVDCRST_MAG86-278 [uncultured Truepera sp.]
MKIAGKTPWLTLHVSSPLQSETPLTLLRETRVTDKANLYIRNNQDLAGSMVLDPAGGDWRVTLVGPRQTLPLGLDDLGRYPQRETEMVLQCSGNSRRRFAGTSPVSGAGWGDGAVANVVFGGVLLRDVLGAAPGLLEGTRYLTARGMGTAHEDDLPAFERSVPLDDVLNTALLATTLNGEPLPALHGGPLRLVLPGYYGVNNVKWLCRLGFDAEPTQNHYQTEKYRLPKRPLEPGTPFEATPANSVPSWRMRLKTLLWRPLVGETLRAGPVDFGGVAWSDGRGRVARVEVSCDRGVNWREADLDTPESPYAWSEWSLTLTLAPGEPEIWVRALDDAGRAQPLDPNSGWNPAGYEWSSAERVRLSVR